MELLMGYMQQGLDFIIPMVILLGLLIFVHEMGHFLVAKYYGVRVEVFSLGFGKALFQFRYGDTDYKLSVIPLGGYVKMFGDNPSDSDEVPEDLRAVSFLHKPVGQRIAIVLAGPLMNFFFAIVLYAMVAMVGESFPKAIVGDVPSTSAAYDAGFQAGDAIHMVGDQKVQLWREVHEKVEATEGEATASDIEKSGLLRFQVKGLDGQIRDVLAKTEVIDNPNIISNDEKVGHIEGLSPLAESVQVAVKPGSLADKAGIQDLDQIVSINEHELRYFYELPHFLSQLKAGTKSLALKVKRTKDAKDQNPETLDVSIALESKKKVTLESLGLDRTNLYLADVIPDTPAYKSGLRRGDHITSINGVALSQWSDLVEQVRTFDPEKNKNLQVSVLRKSDSGEARETKSFSIAPELNSQTQPTGEKKSVFTLGVVRAATFVEPPTTLIRTWNPFTAIWKGTTDTLFYTKFTLLSLVRLVQNRVSPRAVGGPILIGQVASKSFKIGLAAFLKIMALISINLFIINLLPIPVLDGGHLVFFSIEALKGAPISYRKMEMAQQAGLFLLLGLMAFALFNDVTRLFS